MLSLCQYITITTSILERVVTLSNWLWSIIVYSHYHTKSLESGPPWSNWEKHLSSHIPKRSQRCRWCIFQGTVGQTLRLELKMIFVSHCCKHTYLRLVRFLSQLTHFTPRGIHLGSYLFILYSSGSQLTLEFFVHRTLISSPFKWEISIIVWNMKLN